MDLNSFPLDNPNVCHDLSILEIEKNHEHSICKASPKKEKDRSFPEKLHKILSNPTFQHIITWLPDGRSWRVLDAKKFEKEVIPLYFRHRNFASFMRQVNGWGFRGIRRGYGHRSYYHEVR